MARIRTIKPGFWSDEKLAPLDPITRLVFLGLISNADDAGRLIDSVRMIDGMLFPFSEHSSREAIETLARLSRVLRYRSASGQPILQICNWEEHQRVDNPSAHVLPAPTPEDIAAQQFDTSSREPSENLASPSPLEVGSRKKEIGRTDMSKSMISDMWEVWMKELGGKPPHPKLTKKRRRVLQQMFDEQLKRTEDPIGMFRRIIKAVKRSDHHMGTRAYQMPESLFRNEERRDRWVQETINPSKPKPGTEAARVAKRGEPGGRTYTPPRPTAPERKPDEIAKIDAGELFRSLGIRTPNENPA